MEKPLLLFDTDMDTDCDDAAALGLVLQQVNAQNAELLAVGSLRRVDYDVRTTVSAAETATVPKNLLI